jgi:membrane protein implicated in regulation of membrane protease activity
MIGNLDIGDNALEWISEAFFILLAVYFSWRRIYARIRERQKNQFLSPDDPRFAREAWKETLAKDNLAKIMRQHARESRLFATLSLGLGSLLLLIVGAGIIVMMVLSGAASGAGFWILVGLVILSLSNLYQTGKEFSRWRAEKRRGNLPASDMK